MTYQEFPLMMADFIVTVQNGTVTGHMKVPWLNEETCDVALLINWRGNMVRWVGLKIIGTSSPWGGYHAVERWAASFDDVIELHMVHANIYGYGRF